MLNFDSLEKGQRIVSSPHVHDFSRKMEQKNRKIIKGEIKSIFKRLSVAQMIFVKCSTIGHNR